MQGATVEHGQLELQRRTGEDAIRNATGGIATIDEERNRPSRHCREHERQPTRSCSRARERDGRIRVARQQSRHAERRPADVGAVVEAHLIAGHGAGRLAEPPVGDGRCREDGLAVAGGEPTSTH